MVSFSTTVILLLAAAIPAFGSENLIAGYEPATDVGDHANIDRDQKLIEDQLDLETNTGFSTAKDVYMEGAFSKSISTITLDTPLTSALAKDTKVNGTSVSGAQVEGDVFEEAGAGATTIQIQYALSNDGCFVGANPAPIIEGCFAEQGELTIVGSATTLQYTYVPTENTMNGRTIQAFSTNAHEKMAEWKNCKKHFEYYGQFDYANQWVLAAFDGGATSFTNGNADFGSYSMAGKEEAIKKGTAYLNIWMYVLHEMEDAVADCKSGCATTECNDDAVHAWDEAVAFYTGSLEGVDGSGSGVLIYALADKRCVNFNTCSNGITGTSQANQAIIQMFNEGRQKLAAKDCPAAEIIKDSIAEKMGVPLVQGTLRYAHIIGEQGIDTEKAQAEGASFAAASLPLVHDCNPADAEVIYNNMRTGSTSVDFAAVKQAFENNYDCMGITCADVGGLWDTESNDYFANAPPCGPVPTEDNGSSAATLGATAGLMAAGAAALML